MEIKQIKTLFSFLLIHLIAFSSLAQQLAEYSRAKVWCNESELIQLANSGICVDHGSLRKGVWLISDFSKKELEIVQGLGLKTDILIDDVVSYYQQQNLKSNSQQAHTLSNGCDSTNKHTYSTPINFTLGTMGGYFTYNEMLAHLDTMAAKFPNLITVRDTISSFVSHNNNPIWWVKISDNANTDEAEPEVLYTALHHAREPASLSQLIFFMYYLLENYGNDAVVNSIINNTELYFVPMVNPDGYIYNEATQPSGGGMWRKNRRDNLDGEWGVDLNRNYAFQWGFNNSGSSPNTGSNTYRGTSSFSEPETQAIKHFAENREFVIAQNYHTYGNLLIYPWGYLGSFYTPDSALFVEYAKLMTKQNGYTYGTTDQTLGYTTNGDTDDWMYGEQTSKSKIISMTPEAGPDSDGFWPPASRIISICEENMWQNLITAQLAGKYAVAEDLSPTVINSKSGYLPFSIKRLGLDSATTFTVSITPLDTLMYSIGSAISYSGMSLLETKTDSILFTLNPGIANNTSFTVALSVDNGIYTIHDTLVKTYGTTHDVFSDNGNSISNWNTSTWGISTLQYYSASGSIHDSPNGNYNDNSTSTITLSNPIDLTFATQATLSFWTKWDIEPGWDFAQVRASTDGINWTPLCGKYTRPGTGNQLLDSPLYDGIQNTWVNEEVDMSSYIGDTVQLQFRLITDQAVTKDGFYFDDLNVTIMGDDSLFTITHPTINLRPIVLKSIPNPATDQTQIHFSTPTISPLDLVITNSLGELIFHKPINSTTSQIEINTSEYPSGVYFYQVVGDKFKSAVQRMVIIK